MKDWLIVINFEGFLFFVNYEFAQAWVCILLPVPVEAGEVAPLQLELR